MKKRKKNQLRLLWVIGVMAIFLLAPLSARAAEPIYVDCDGEAHYVNTIDIECGEGTTHLINTPVDGLHVWADTTVNLEADVSEYIYVFPGGTLNIYSGNVGWWIGLLKDELQNPTVTVYGKNFAVDGVDLPEGTNQFLPVSEYPGSLLTGIYGNGESIHLRFASDVPVYLQPPPSEYIEVVIDIKPGSNHNRINLKSRGVVPVAVITTKDFDASTINPETVTFAGASPVLNRLCYIDRPYRRRNHEEGDGGKGYHGGKNMLFFFKTKQLNLDENSTEATLTGETKDGQKIAGIDKVRIVQCRKKAKHSFLNSFNSKHKRSWRNRKYR